MRFEEFWKILVQKVSEPTNFYTLHRKKLFSASYSNGRITIRPEKTKSDRTLYQDSFKRVWKKASTLSKNERYKPSNYLGITFHASYILAMIKSIIGNEELE